MIKANELRVGNLVKLEGRILTVNDISFRNVGVVGYSPVTPKRIDPIEITEKHITDFGFISRKTDRKFDLNDFSVKVNKEGGAFFYFDNFCVAGFGYVHQLQNLYFALTGSELVFSTEP